MKRELIALVAALAVAAPGAAANVDFLRLQSQEAFLRGTLDGLSVDALGTLRLAAHAERVAAIGEPFLLSAAAHPEGWVVGTGNSGRVLLVPRRGQVRELFATSEPEVFAVWVDAQGTVFAASSPRGKVYRWSGGKAETFFDPGETYIWELAGLPDGDLLVATGTQGRLYRVDARGRGRVWWESGDTHVRSVAALPEGGALAGTAGKGVIVRIAPDGAVRTLYDSAHPEVVAFAPGPDGQVYAAVVASEASQLPAPQPARREEGSEGARGQDGESEGEGTVAVVVEDSTAARPTGSRPPGFRGARSEILRISPGGTVESVARLEAATVYSLLWATDRLWIGTGLEGKLYSLRGGELVLENDVDERQIVALIPAGSHPVFATTNAAAFYRLTAEGDRQGTYTSPVLDAAQVSRFGTFRWLGQEPAGSTLSFSFRSGLSSEPDQTWSSWTAPRRGSEIVLEGVPAARFFQWRLTAQSRGQEGPALASTEVSFRQENLAPRITRLEVMDPGEVLVPATFSPGNQVFEPAHPTRDGIFTTLRPASEPGDGRLRTLWRQGYRTLRWQAADPNDDKLTYTLSFRPEGGGEWLAVEEQMESSHYSFDSTVLPDGVYRFRLEVRDRHPGASDGLSDLRVTPPVVVDHTPPELLSVRRRGSTMVVEVEDALSPLREARYSVDGGEWLPAPPQDGLLDGTRETLVLEVPPEARLVMLRLMDAAFNSASFDLLRHLD